MDKDRTIEVIDSLEISEDIDGNITIRQEGCSSYLVRFFRSGINTIRLQVVDSTQAGTKLSKEISIKTLIKVKDLLEKDYHQEDEEEKIVEYGVIIRAGQGGVTVLVEKTSDDLMCVRRKENGMVELEVRDEDEYFEVGTSYLIKFIVLKKAIDLFVKNYCLVPTEEKTIGNSTITRIGHSLYLSDIDDEELNINNVRVEICSKSVTVSVNNGISGNNFATVSIKSFRAMLEIASKELNINNVRVEVTEGVVTILAGGEIPSSNNFVTVNQKAFRAMLEIALRMLVRYIRD